MPIRVKMTLTVPIEINQRGKWFFASCPVLDVVSQGETFEKAKKNLGQALELFVTSCLERGTLDEVLKQCGFKPGTGSVPAPAKARMTGANYLNIPIPFLVNPLDGNLRCHA